MQCMLLTVVLIPCNSVCMDSCMDECGTCVKPAAHFNKNCQECSKYDVHDTGTSGDLFDVRNRISLPGSLHRISAMKGDQGGIHGLTYRIGRHMPGRHVMHTLKCPGYIQCHVLRDTQHSILSYVLLYTKYVEDAVGQSRRCLVSHHKPHGQHHSLQHQP